MVSPSKQVEFMIVLSICYVNAVSVIACDTMQEHSIFYIILIIVLQFMLTKFNDGVRHT